MRFKAPSASARSLCVEYWTSWIYNLVSSFVIRAKLHNNGTQTITTCQGWDHCFENVCAAIGTVLNGGVTCAFSIKILIENHFQQSNNDVSSISPFFWRGGGQVRTLLVVTFLQNFIIATVVVVGGRSVPQFPWFESVCHPTRTGRESQILVVSYLKRECSP